jgi:DNA polymerase-3 subunit alpha
MSDFVHLHLHSQYSLLDGANRIGDLMATAAEQEMPAVALTDHGNLFGAIEFYDAARKAGIKPIIGIEAYISQGSMRDRDPKRAHSNHLVLLARNEVGYRNLLKLTTKSYLEGFYYKPRIDKELLRKHSEGLICLSACLNGEVNEKILGGREDEARALTHEYLDMFGEGNYFLEMQDHGIPEQRDANAVVRRLAQRDGIPLVITNDCHYLRHDDAFAHDVLLCIGTQKTLDDPNRLRYSGDQFYMKNAAEIYEAFPGEKVAIENTLRIAEACNLEIPKGSFHLPEFPVPPSETLVSYLEKVARAGLDERLASLRTARGRPLERNSPEAYRQRLESELQVIVRMGFAGYFLIVWDFMRYAREQSIPVGPGRGSAAGSVVSYALRITDIDPLQYDLIFERFLNPDRVSMPDIDIDFCMRRRGEVIQYVNEKYGRDRVAQIITFGTLGAKAVVRDVGRVMGTPFGTIDRIAKLVPDMTKSISEAAREIDALKTEVSRDAEIRRIVEVGGRLEGLTRHASLHAAGVVITPQAIEELVPLYKTSKDEIVTQWDKDVVESLGLLKMDFLGLRTLTVIDDTLKNLAHQGIELDLDAVELDDDATYLLFCEGRTNGIFQFESRGMKDLLRRAQPSKFEDLAAFNALYRPGALSVGMVDEFIQRKTGQKKVRYLVPETEPILAETYGVIAYQEQVMQIAVAMAGFTAGEADVLRKAMGKKSPEVMAEQKEKFLDGAEAKGHARDKAREVWEYIEPFAGYGFNKSHSVAYAMLAYKTAYLKTHHPVAFMAAMLTSEMTTADNVAKYVRECQDMGIQVLPPDINSSRWPFTVEGDAIRFGLGAVKGVGEGAIEAILEVRARVGSFRGLFHLATEMDTRIVNRKVFECLIKSGCFDALGFTRSGQMEGLEAMLDRAQRRRREREAGQTTLFAEAAMDAEPASTVAEWPNRLRLQFEREALGLYLTGNPLNDFTEVLRRRTSHSVAGLAGSEGQTVTLGGMVTGFRQAKIKSGQNAGRFMGRLVLADLEGTVPVAVFADQFEKFRRFLHDDAIVLIVGQVRDRGGDFEVRADEIESIEGAAEKQSELLLEINGSVSMSQMLELRNVLAEHPGASRVLLRFSLPGRTVNVSAGENFRVKADDELVQSVEQLLGRGRAEMRTLESAPEELRAS